MQKFQITSIKHNAKKRGGFGGGRAREKRVGHSDVWSATTDYHRWPPYKTRGRDARAANYADAPGRSLGRGAPMHTSADHLARRLTHARAAFRPRQFSRLHAAHVRIYSSAIYPFLPRISIVDPQQPVRFRILYSSSSSSSTFTGESRRIFLSMNVLDFEGTISYNCIIYSINRKFLDIRWLWTNMMKYTFIDCMIND